MHLQLMFKTNDSKWRLLLVDSKDVLKFQKHLKMIQSGYVQTKRVSRKLKRENIYKT